MKIIVTDGATLNPGDLSWEALGQFGDYEVYPQSTTPENLQRCLDAEIAITNKVIFDRSTIESLPKLKYIGVTATGYNNIDLQAASQRGIIVTNVPTYGTDSVAQMVFALLLELTQRVGYHSETVHEGRWSSSSNFCYWDYPLIELTGLTMGVVGCGRIGKAVAHLADAFGMDVLGYDTVSYDSQYIKQVQLVDLFASSDVISLHCPLTAETQGMINSASLSLMKKTAFLINTSRGPLVNEQDLADALNEKRIAGAGVDVLSLEPPKSCNPLLSAENCIITPHIAWATHSARKRLLELTIENLQAFLAGKPQNIAK